MTTGAELASRREPVADGAAAAGAAPLRPVGTWGFTGFAIISLGGPLALAALIVPVVAGDATPLTLAGAVVFGAPLLIWLRYADRVSSSGGLYGFVEAAAGRRVALVQAAVWTVSYLLYIIYTTVQVVYEVLGTVLPGSQRYATVLALVVPVALVAIVVAGRGSALLAAGLIAAVQVVLLLVLAALTLAHLPLVMRIPAGQGADDLAQVTGQSALLYVCASLPLFLGGELARPARTFRRVLPAVVAATAIVIALTVLPLSGAGAGELLHAPVPGMAVAARFSGQGLADAIGIGVALSIAGVMLAEYVALTRLAHAVSGISVRRAAAAIGVVLLAVAPFSLINPDGFYSSLIKPSLLALWVSQLIVFLVYPRFARRHGQALVPAGLLTAVAVALGGYGIYVTLVHPSS